jgi:hypothetical protein
MTSCHTAEAPPGQAATELQPEGLSLAGAHRQAEDALLAAVAHAHGHHRGLAHDPAARADFLVDGVEPDIRVGLVERTVAELGQLLVELRADAAHFTAADAAATQGGHEVVHLAGADAEHVCLLDHRQQRPVDAPPWFEERREEAPRAQLGNLQLEASRAVSRIRSRWPLRYVVRVNARSWGAAPM